MTPRADSTKKNLLIVESPAKARTIHKYLGQAFDVMASYGHVRDLIPKGGAVEPENNFLMHYQLIEKNEKHIQAIAKALKQSEALYLATDPDREGEAIAWHIQEILKAKKLLQKKPVYRVVFHEITKTAIQDAIQNPRTIGMDLVHAQQARRVLDYLVGFKLSPLLWKKIHRGLSAGRVQSPAVRLILEREQEIRAFLTQEYWTITAMCQTVKSELFSAKLSIYQHDKLSQFSIASQDQAETFKKHLLASAKGSLTVADIQKKQRQRKPAAPFTTSTLQQEASSKLGFTAQRTMRTAQQLYENGFITYMRTDAVYLAQEAVTEIRSLITQQFGMDYLPDAPCVYKNKSKNAQEAHEAVRPTSVLKKPESLQNSLSSEQYRLYQLIWQRAVACQMKNALMNTVSVDLSCAQAGMFRASGSTIAHPGFLAVYLDDSKYTETENLLPVLQTGDVVRLIDIVTEQHFTQPPPRYTEATLVKALEEYGIGRPSTYASIISTIQNRNYVKLEQKRFYPTDIGEIVGQFLLKYFNRYIDYGFTATLEDNLDAIARGEKPWLELLKEFWSPFQNQLAEIDHTVSRQDVTAQMLEEQCPKCNKILSIRLGRRGKFIGCTGYPTCDYTRDLQETQQDSTSTDSKSVTDAVSNRVCPECQSALQVRYGKYGQFIGCSAYPTCKFIEPLNKPESTGVNCPECKNGQLFKRKSRYGKFFYACNAYPGCKYALWYPPIQAFCPKCHWPVLILKETKRYGKLRACPQKSCDFSEPILD